ncbi:MAG: hypothetical protein U0Q18_03380 [Bryobacteraceae bacterium]
MEIVDRYLHAIEFWLPKAQRQDILAELTEDIRSQIEDRESQLGRKLNESEVESLLRERGGPLLVANRFLPNRSLIGPGLFPIYIFVLKILAFGFLPSVAWLIVRLILDPVAAWPHDFALSIGTLWTGAFTTFGAVTLVFAILERRGVYAVWLNKWDPRRLPAVRNPNEIGRGTSVFEVLVHTVAAIWWIEQAWAPSILNVSLSFTPVWAYFYWGFLAIILMNAALSVTNLMRPYWTRARASLRLAVDGAGAVLFCCLLKANVIAGITIAGASAARALQIQEAIQVWLERLFPWAVLAVAVILACDLYRIIRVNGKAGRLNREALAM